MRKALFLLLVSLSSLAWGQGSCVLFPAQLTTGAALTDATSNICSKGTAPNSCVSGVNLISTFSDESLGASFALTQPIHADSSGNTYVCVSPGTYEICTTSPRASGPYCWNQQFYATSVTAPAPTFTCTPLSLSFPNTNTGQTSAPLTVSCSNSSTSGTAVVFSGVTLTTGTNFAIGGQTCGTLQAGQSCTIPITFSPTAVQAYSDTLNISSSNAQVSPFTIALSGTGQTPSTPTPSSAAIFPASPSLSVGGTSAETATLTMSDGSGRNCTNGCFYWNSATPANATIDQTGKITGVAAGTSVVSANAGVPVPGQVAEKNAGAGPTTSLILSAFPNTTQAGNRIMVAACWGAATGSVSSVTDSCSNTYASIASTLEQANSNSCQWWTTTGIPACSSDAVTVNFAGGGVAFPDVVAFETQGDTTVDQAAVGTIASGTSLATTAITPAQASEVIYSATVVGNFVKAVNSGAFCITAGNSGQTGINTACPVSPSGGSVFFQDTFSTSAVTPTATTNASSNGVISAVALKTVSGSTTATVANSGTTVYTLANPPSAGTQLYPTSPASVGISNTGALYNIAIPAGAKSFPLQHCFGNTSNCSTGDANAQFTFTANGQCSPSASPTTTGGCGLLLFHNANSNSDLGKPIWYSKPATDPFYSIGSACNLNTPGLNFKFQCPSNAVFAGGSTDQGMICFDQAQNLAVSLYAFGKGIGFGIGACPGGGHAGTLADPCPIPGISACNAARVGIDPNYNGNQTYSETIGSNTYSLGLGDNGVAPLATLVRIAEASAGNINHAIFIGVPCTNPTVKVGVPANGQTDLLCVSGGGNGLPVDTRDPIYGGLYWCDYTSTQVSGMGLPAWQAAILNACNTYGMYVSYTIGSASAFEGFNILNTVESQQASATTGVTTSPINSICQQSPNHFAVCTQGSPAVAIAEGDVFNSSIPLTVTSGSTSTDTSNRACGSGGGCDWTGHVHLLDSCVAKTMAGLPGGC